MLPQSFSANAIGLIFFVFAVIHREGDEGFSEGNFSAPFVSIGEDRPRRGVLTAALERRGRGPVRRAASADPPQPIRRNPAANRRQLAT